MEQNNNRPLGWTTLDKAKQLVEAGLPVETADMSYTYDFDDSRYVITTTPVKNWIVPKYAESTKIKQVLPCWSLEALSILMPKIYENERDGGCYPILNMDYNTNKWYCGYRYSIYMTNYYNTGIEAAIDMIL